MATRTATKKAAPKEEPLIIEPEDQDSFNPAKNSKKSGTAAWFTEGWDAVEEEGERQKFQREIGRRGADRFYLRPGDKARILFLDSKPAVFFLHGMPPPGKKVPQFKSCLFGVEPVCEACQVATGPYKKLAKRWTAHLSIIHLQNWSNDQNKWVPAGYMNNSKNEWMGNRKILFPMQQQSAAIMKIHVDAWKGATGCMVEVTRPPNQLSATCGEIFTLVEKIRLNDRAALKKYGIDGIDLNPINYKEDMKALSQEGMRAWLESVGIPIGGNSSVAEEVPY